jgi:antitoxin (DNA-binding transcriptional repressor) of toxin-antitoxin stability system
MSSVSIRELRNNGGEVVERARRGEQVIITSSGEPVAELRALARAPLSLEALIERRRHLPHVDPAQLRADIDSVIDQRMW